MSNKPIFVATHPRACSTAFERVFMTRRDILQCVHEPFGDAYYFGPERLHPRYEEDEKARLETGFGESTYRSIFEKIERENTEGKRIFIKDMAQYWIPPDGNPASIAPSLVSYRRGVGTDANGTQEANGTNGVDDTKAAVAAKNPPYPYDTAAEPNNPTVVPEELLKKFHFTFLIRHPSSSIPSYYRCTIPPLDAITGFYNFMPSEAGYGELRRLFDYLRSVGHVNSHIAGQANGVNGIDGDKGSGVDVCVIDADDLLDNPSGIIETFCNSVGIDYNPSMLKWDNDEDHRVAKEAFEKWKGFHEDAIDSTELKPRKHKVRKSEDELYAEWKEKYGEEGANVIRDTARASVDDYNYLKQFAVKV